MPCSFIVSTENHHSGHHGATAPRPNLPDEVPTVYSANLTQGDGFFLSSKMQMHSEDIVFVSNAPSGDLLKVLNLLLPLTYSITNSRSGFN